MDTLRARIQKFIDKEIAKDFSIGNRELWDKALDEGFEIPRSFDWFRRLIIDARKRNVGSLRSRPADGYDPHFDVKRLTGTDNEKARALIRNEVLREKYQTTQQLINTIEAAGLRIDARQHTVTSWVSEIRREVGREITNAEARTLAETTKDHGKARNRLTKPRVDIHAGPPRPGEVTEYAARRMAADVIREAWETAGKRKSNENSSIHQSATRAPSFAVRYAQAWLQTPDATALWCGILDVDPDTLRARSRQRHGVPEFSHEEIISFRNQIAERKQQIAKERARYA